MKKTLAMLLTTALIMGLFAGCSFGGDPTGGKDDVKMELISPVAMVSFDPSPVAGFTMEPPADLTTAGTCQTKTVSVLVGDNDGSYTVRTLKGYESEMAFTLSGVKANAPAMLDIEEIHLRSDGAIAYSVYVNGTEV